MIFDLLDELAESFGADAMHVGMDEVQIICSDFCPRCKAADPAKMFAKAVTDLHEHVVAKRKLQMLMWGDRLLDGKATGYGDYEGSENGTWSAIDLVPRDIVMCDWHYEKREEYPSIPLFLEKGFAVWPAGWDNVAATEALIDYARKHAGPKMLGHLCTVWSRGELDQLSTWPAIVTAMKKL